MVITVSLLSLSPPHSRQTLQVRHVTPSTQEGKKDKTPFKGQCSSQSKIHKVGMIWVGSVATSKLLHSHIKQKSPLKACRANMPH